MQKAEMVSCMDLMLFEHIKAMKDGDPDKTHFNNFLDAKAKAHAILADLCTLPMAECAACLGCRDVSPN